MQPWRTPSPVWNQSVVPCPVLTVAFWPAYRFLRRQVRWSGIPSSLRIFQFVVIHKVKGFGIVNEAEIDVFLEFPCFSNIQNYPYYFFFGNESLSWAHTQGGEGLRSVPGGSVSTYIAWKSSVRKTCSFTFKYSSHRVCHYGLIGIYFGLGYDLVLRSLFPCSPCASLGHCELFAGVSGAPCHAPGLLFIQHFLTVWCTVCSRLVFCFPCCVCSVTQSCLTLCNPMDCSPPGSSVHGISQARTLAWVAISSSIPFPCKDWTCFSFVPCIAGSFCTTELSGKPFFFPCSSPRITHVSKEPWFLLLYCMIPTVLENST